MTTQIPIYRAKKIDSDEFIFGTGTTDFLNINAMNVDTKYKNDGSRLWLWSNYSWIEIDKNTLALHFPDMIDKNGKRIFASLSEDGVGGDIVDTTIGLRQNFIAICRPSGICVLTSDTSAIKNTPINTVLNYSHRGLEVIGIRKG